MVKRKKSKKSKSKELYDQDTSKHPRVWDKSEITEFGLRLYTLMKWLNEMLETQNPEAEITRKVFELSESVHLLCVTDYGCSEIQQVSHCPSKPWHDSAHKSQ